MNPQPSTIIIAQDVPKLEAKVVEIANKLNCPYQTNNPDLLQIEALTDGISEIRQIKKFISQKSFKYQNKLVVIHHADHLGQESQNALLVILENPPKNNFLVLTVSQLAPLLPTVTSRCHLLHLTQNKPTAINNSLLDSPDSLQDKLLLVDSLVLDKDKLSKLLESELQFLKDKLIADPSEEKSKIVSALIKCISMISHNVDPKSALDYFFLSTSLQTGTTSLRGV